MMSSRTARVHTSYQRSGLPEERFSDRTPHPGAGHRAGHTEASSAPTSKGFFYRLAGDDAANAPDTRAAEPVLNLCVSPAYGAAHRCAGAAMAATNAIRPAAGRKKTYPDKSEAPDDCAGTAEFRSCSW